MTGQGVGEAAVGAPHPGATLAPRVIAEVRAVNHRYLDVRVRAPGELGEHVQAAEEVIRRLLVRGRVELSLQLDGELVAPPALDVARARGAFRQLVLLRDELAPGEPVPLALLATVPELFSAGRSAGRREALRDAVTAATEDACKGAIAMRLHEGASLVADFELRLARLLSSLEAIEARVPAAIESARLKLRERVARLLDPAVSLDPSRLEHEVALLADRSDVTEECTRLRSHVAQMRRALREQADGRGKRIDFLCQEIARESNTIGQKSADAELAARVIDLKCEVERMREQAQNIL